MPVTLGSTFANAHHGVGASTIDSSNGTINATDVGSLLLAMVCVASVSETITVALDPAGINLNIPLFGSYNNNNNTTQIQVFASLAPPAVTSKALRATYSGGVSIGILGLTFNGVEQQSIASAIHDQATDINTGTGPSASVRTRIGDATISFVVDNSTATLTNVGSQTTLFIDNTNIDFGAGYILSLGDSDTHAWHYGTSVPYAEALLRIVQQRQPMPQNYQSPKGGDGMGFSERVR